MCKRIPTSHCVVGAHSCSAADFQDVVEESAIGIPPPRGPQVICELSSAIESEWLLLLMPIPV